MEKQTFMDELSALCNRVDGPKAYAMTKEHELEPYRWQNYLNGLAIGLTKREALDGAINANPCTMVSFRMPAQGGYF